MMLGWMQSGEKEFFDGQEIGAAHPPHPRGAGGAARRQDDWAAAGFKETLLRCESEVVHGYKTAVQPEFKIEAVKLVTERGVAASQVAKDLHIHENVFRKWVREQRKAFPGNGQMKPELAEIARLKKENAKLRMERDILKKAAAYFAKESM